MDVGIRYGYETCLKVSFGKMMKMKVLLRILLSMALILSPQLLMARGGGGHGLGGPGPGPGPGPGHVAEQAAQHATGSTSVQAQSAQTTEVSRPPPLIAIMKFKMHKDNPTQVPIGTPVMLTFIAAALLFLPSILNVTGSTMTIPQ